MRLTPEFEKMLHRFMRMRQLKTKSEAIRIAVKEGCEHVLRIGFESDDALWS